MTATTQTVTIESITRQEHDRSELLAQLKREGFKKVNIIDLVDGLNLPVEQIEKVMDNLEGVKI